MIAQPIAQPLHDRARDEDRYLPARTRSRRRSARPMVVSSPFFDGDGVAPVFMQHEAAGAVGVLGHAGLEAGLAEERGLLVAGDAGDRDRRAEQTRLGLAIDLARRAHLRQHRARHAEELQQLVVPSPAVDVVAAACGWRC